MKYIKILKMCYLVTQKEIKSILREKGKLKTMKYSKTSFLQKYVLQRHMDTLWEHTGIYR